MWMGEPFVGSIMAVVIDGTAVSQNVRAEIGRKARRLQDERGVVPGLAVILVGDDPASHLYVTKKEQACAEVGFLSREHKLPGDTGEERILDIVGELNTDDTIHGILVQLPLPRHINPETVINAIDPKKDVDGFHPLNLGRLVTGTPFHTPCTPSGILELLDHYGIDIEGREAVIVGRSTIVGRPLSLLLLSRHVTVTVCHTRTRDLPRVTGRAEILVAAAGSPGMITDDMVRDRAVVIDVGINRLPGGGLVGDVVFDQVSKRASYITPVPGGVGPMTIAMLLRNTLRAADLLG